MDKKIYPRPWKDQIETARKSEALKMVIPTTKEDLAWDAACGNHGYGVLNRNNKVISAHRLSYELYYGLIPKGKHVLHTCDVRPCVNPDHLFLGSNSDNVADKVAKERHVFGEASAISKLTNAQVMSIRQKYAQGGTSHRKLAREYDVSHQLIAGVVNQERWRHVKSQL
jgi:hypothetical protein